MRTFEAYVEDRHVDDLTASLGRLLERNEIHPFVFAEQEMSGAMLSELWGMFGGQKPAPATAPASGYGTPIDFKTAMRAVLEVINQVKARGMGNRMMSFTSGSMAGQSIPLVSWLGGVVDKLGKLNSKLYSPAQPYGQPADAWPAAASPRGGSGAASNAAAPTAAAPAFTAASF